MQNISPAKTGEIEGDEANGEESQKKKKKRRKNKKKKKKGAKQEGVDATTAISEAIDGNQLNDNASQGYDDEDEDNESAASAEDLEFEEDLKQFSLRLQALQQQSSMLSSSRSGGPLQRRLRPNVSDDWLRTIREQCKN
jgi:hypothetical protein